MPIRQITAATSNPAKLHALQELVSELVAVVPLPFATDDAAFADVGDEQGDTIEAIATSKATGWSRLLAERGLDSLTIASDGGLLIPALGESWDSRRTRRFAGDAASDLERCRALLTLAEGLTGKERAISWQEAVAIADRGELVGRWIASGSTGRLGRTVREELLDRTPGFWIPALWEVPEADFRRLTELTSEERNRIADHWSALRAPVRAALAQYLQTPSHAMGVSDV